MDGQMADVAIVDGGGELQLPKGSQVNDNIHPILVVLGIM